MIREDLKHATLPAVPGVYLFCDAKGKILYVGKATSLRDRVRSYFNTDVVSSRGPLIMQMVEEAKTVTYEETDSVLEALILEAALIKKHQPKYNTKEKSDKSFYYVVITDEEYPRVLLRRERELFIPGGSDDVRSLFGPFPRGGVLKDALKIVRKIFPFRDTCKPKTGKPCFNRQIGLCPGVCSGEMSAREYRAHIKRLELFLGGKKTELLAQLEREMERYARKELFEEALRIKRTLYNLKHIQDIALIKREDTVPPDDTFRIEGYDVAHLGGSHTVGVMTVHAGGQVRTDEYRMFTIRNAKPGDDIGALTEVLERRLAHPEWLYPRLIVIDGGKNQKNRAEKVLTAAGVVIPVVSVVKDERHKAREILGDKALVRKYETDIIAVNAEAHRFAIGSYRRKQRKAAFL
ncbi:MAG: GIY-YIG nuclease family protein [Candidatus Yonathbacteria bacterium]|nr:GIY-YIG nuclease family protein [Candidatus Yonathbacteria bacterium]